MSELDDFLTTTLTRQIEAEEAIHNGDPTLRMQLRSSHLLNKSKASSKLISPSESCSRTFNL